MLCCRIKPDTNDCCCCVDDQLDKGIDILCSECPEKMVDYKILGFVYGFFGKIYVMLWNDKTKSVKRVSAKQIIKVWEECYERENQKDISEDKNFDKENA